MSKMGLHDLFGHLQHKLWPKERSRVKLVFWLPTTESQESTWFPCVQVACNTSLKSSGQGLQLWFKLHPDWRFAPEVIVLQSCGTPSLRCHSRRMVQSILYGGRWWLPLSPGRGESCESRVACLRTKGALEGELTNLLVGLIQVRVQ
jgi:hypothetical protein